MKLENIKDDSLNLHYYKVQYINNILKDYNKKIKEKQNHLFMNKEKLNLFI